jgi:hypothetical protein
VAAVLAWCAEQAFSGQISIMFSNNARGRDKANKGNLQHEKMGLEVVKLPTGKVYLR